MISSPLGILAPPDHPVASLKEISYQDYATHPFVLPGDAWLRHSGLGKLLDGRHAPRNVVARAERPAILKALVRAGLGIAFLTRLGAEHNDLVWIPLAEGTASPALVALMVPRDHDLPLSRAVLADILKDCMREEDTA